MKTPVLPTPCRTVQQREREGGRNNNNNNNNNKVAQYTYMYMHPSILHDNNETPTVCGLAADNNNKLYTETMIFLWNNHYNLNFIM